MTQVIFLSFNSFNYKKNPNARLFINNTFIDEFEISEFISSDFLKRINDNKPYNDYINKVGKQIVYEPSSRGSEWEDLPVAGGPGLKIKVWEIDSSAFHKEGENKIEIKVSNDDNNYTNGLMTLSTLIELKDFYILPKKVLDGGTLQSYYFRHENIKGSKKIASYYKERSIFFDNLKEHTTFTGDQDEKTVGASRVMVGGSGTFQCTTRTKHGFQKCNLRPGFWRIRQATMKYIINKYSKAHENQ
jgi:hypothetical protein